MKYLTHAKILDQRNPRKKFDPRNPCNPRKNLTHSIHAPTDPRNPRTHVTHATIQPTRFSRNVIVHADNIWCSMVWWEFEKWRAIRPSLGGVGGVLVWVACLRGWCGWRPIVIVTVVVEILSWRKECWMFTFEKKLKKCSKKIRAVI